MQKIQFTQPSYKKKRIIFIYFLILFFSHCQIFNQLGLSKDKSKGIDPMLLLLWLAVQCPSLKSDPLMKDQWHLSNTGQSSGTSGIDIKAVDAWSRCAYGNNVTVAVVDDGMDLSHEDLKENVYTGLSYNYTNGSQDVSSSTAKHGTAVSGIIGGRDNEIGIRGIAPRAKLAGFNLLAKSTTANEGDAMTRESTKISVSNNSWGPEDYTGEYIPSNSTWQSAILYGVTKGRDSKGIVYVWAGGNGGRPSSASSTEIDNSNYDGYANNPYVFAVSAVGNDGVRSYYSEKGANLLVAAPSKGNNSVGILTTDITGNDGYNTNSTSNNVTDKNYSNQFGGTSAAAPVVSGVVAMLMGKNSNLTWRDVRMILAKTATQVSFSDSDWRTNGIGLKVNHKYGFGMINALEALKLAETWSLLPAQKSSTVFSATVGTSIPDNNATGISNTIVVSSSGISSIESVLVTFTTNHTYPADLDIQLSKLGGTSSQLAETHVCINSTTGSTAVCSLTITSGWTFHSLRNMGESADGSWTLTVADKAAVDTGTFQNWSIKFLGY